MEVKTCVVQMNHSTISVYINNNEEDDILTGFCNDNNTVNISAILFHCNYRVAQTNRAVGHRVSKKCTCTPISNFDKCGQVSKFFTDRFSSKIAIKAIINDIKHLKCVARLPCEMPF